MLVTGTQRPRSWFWGKKQTLDSHCTARCHMCAAHSNLYIPPFLCRFVLMHACFHRCNTQQSMAGGRPASCPLGPCACIQLRRCCTMGPAALKA
jgi:hypothetical protein